MTESLAVTPERRDAQNVITLFGDSVLIEQITPAKKTGQLILNESGDPRMNTYIGKVIGHGPGVRSDHGVQMEMPCQVGDIVLFPAVSCMRLTMDLRSVLIHNNLFSEEYVKSLCVVQVSHLLGKFHGSVE